MSRETEKLVGNNKKLEDKIRKEKQRGENSKEKYDLLPINDSTSNNELKNALKKKEEMEEKKRSNIKRISTKLKEKLRKKQIGELEISESVILEREESEKSKIINKFKKRMKSYYNPKSYYL